MRLAPAFLSTFFFRQLTIVAAFVNAVVLARALGPADYGAYALVVTATALVAQALSLGLSHSNRVIAARSPEKAGALLTLSGILLLVYAPLAAAAAFGFPDLLPALFGPMPLEHGHFAFVGAGFLLLLLNVDGVLFGLQRYLQSNIATSLPIIGVGATNLCVFVLARNELRGALGIWLAWLAASAALTCVLAMRAAKPSRSLDLGLSREAVGMGARALLCAMFAFAADRGIILLINHHAGTAAVGRYSVALALALILTQAPGALSSILVNRASARTMRPADVMRLIRLHVVLSGAAAAAILIAAPQLLRILFGGDYADAAPVLRILVPGSYMYGIWSIAAAYPTGRHAFPPVVILLVALAAALALGLGAWLLPRMDLRGAAVGWTASWTTVSLLVLLVFSRDARGEIGWKDLLPRWTDFTTAWEAVFGGRRAGPLE